MMDAKLAMLWLRIRGSTHRYLLCSPEERPHMGHPTFDFMAYFGFGSGELHSTVPDRFEGVKVRVRPCTISDPNVLRAYMSATLHQPTDGFSGFFTEDGENFFELVNDENGHDLFHTPELDWRYYTAIGGMRSMAVDHLKAFARRHVLFATPEQQSELLAKYASLAYDV